jgi:hypothetical protein
MLRCLDFLVLAFLRPAANQNHNPVAIPANVNAVAGTEVDFVFIHARANASRV